MRPGWEATGGQDGYVSVEVAPDLAFDAPATMALARRLHEHAGFPNLLVKIPRYPAGADRHGRGGDRRVGVNVTLLFSDTHYLQAA